jgi:hypothetical protein
VSRSGKTNTVARPATSLSGAFAFATYGSTAASYWIGPSTFRSGLRVRTASVARRTASTVSPRPDSPVEYDSIAINGSIPKLAAVSAELIAMSASCPSSGVGFTAQSP